MPFYPTTALAQLIPGFSSGGGGGGGSVAFSDITGQASDNFSLNTALNNKQNKVLTAVQGNLATFNNAGQTQDSGNKISDLVLKTELAATVSDDATLASNSSNLLPTQHAVKSYVDSKTLATVGSANADFTTVGSATAAGKTNILIISSVTEPSVLAVTQSTTITISDNITWTSLSTGSFISVNGTNVTLTVNTIGNGQVVYSPTSQFQAFVITGSSNVSFYRNGLNLDMSGTTATGNSVVRNVAKVYSEGNTVLKLPNLNDVGFRYIGATEIIENSNITLIGGGSNCSNVITVVSGATPRFTSILTLSGTFSNSVPVINVNSIINTIYSDLTCSTPISLSLGGFITGITTALTSQVVNVIVNSNNTGLSNANLNAGVLSIGSFTGFVGTRITSTSMYTANAGSNPVFSNCSFPGSRTLSVGSIYEFQDSFNLFASSINGDDSLNNGTEGYPFSTIARMQSSSSNNSILNLRGTFNENVIFDTYDYQVLTGQNIAFEPLTTINGQVKITAASERVYISDLAINYNAGSPIWIDSTNGAHGMNNLYITTTSQYAIEIDYSTSSSTQKVFISNTDFRTTSGIIMLTDIVGGGTGTLELGNCIGVNIHIGSGWSVSINNSSLSSVSGANSQMIQQIGLASEEFDGYMLNEDFAKLLYSTSVIDVGGDVPDEPFDNTGSFYTLRKYRSLNVTAPDSIKTIYLPDLENDLFKSSYDYTGDTWEVLNNSVSNYHIEVVDRNGRKIFESTSGLQNSVIIEPNVKTVFKWEDKNPDPNNRVNPIRWVVL